MIYRHYILSIALLALAALCSCASGDVPVSEPDQRPIALSAAPSGTFQPLDFSRDGSGLDDVQSRTPILPETVGLYGEMQGYLYDIFFNQIVYNTEGAAYADPTTSADVISRLPEGFTWPSEMKWIYAPLKYWSAGGIYQFYCYAPHSTVENTKVTLTNNSYADMKLFRIANIPPYSSYDYSVSSAIVDQYTGQVPSGVVSFAMEHVSARICIRMKIGEEYSKMRRIRVKEVTINDREDGAYYYTCSKDLVNGSLSVAPSGTYTPGGSKKVLVIPIFDDALGLELKADAYQQFGSLYVMPQALKFLTINVKYDVYDLVNSDPTRLDQQVSNTIAFDKTVVSGTFYNVNIVISPEYLYVLSDDDIKPDLLISPEPEPTPTP